MIKPRSPLSRGRPGGWGWYWDNLWCFRNGLPLRPAALKTPHHPKTPHPHNVIPAKAGTSVSPRHYEQLPHQLAPQPTPRTARSLPPTGEVSCGHPYPPTPPQYSPPQCNLSAPPSRRAILIPSSPTLRGRDERSGGGCRMGWGSLQLQRGMDDPGREMAPRPGTDQGPGPV